MRVNKSTRPIQDRLAQPALHCWKSHVVLICVFCVHCCLVVTCWERADLLALVGDVYCIFVSFPCGILGQVWYFLVSFPDHCHLSYFNPKAPIIIVFFSSVIREFYDNA